MVTVRGGAGELRLAEGSGAGVRTLGKGKVV